MSSPYQSLDEHWKKRAQYEVLEDPEKVEDNICALRALVQDVQGLYSRTDDTFLLAFLRARKHNVNEAFITLKNFYEIKKSKPKYLEYCLPSENSRIYDMEIVTVLEQTADCEQTVMILRVEKMDFRKVTIEEVFQVITTALSFCLEHPHAQISGINFIVDLTGYNFQHVLQSTPSHVSLFVKIFQDSFPVRVKGIHVVNNPIILAPIYALAKRFMKEKMKRRMHLHGSNMSSLHTHIPYEILPQQLGGILPNFNFNSFRNKVQQQGNMIKAWRKYGYNKKPIKDMLTET